MIDDGLETIDITPPASEAALISMGSNLLSGVRSVLAFPLRVLTSVWANGTILLIGVLAVAIGASIFLGILALVVCALLLCLLAVALFAVCFGLVRIGDWISGKKTVAFLPAALQNAADKVNVTTDIGNIRAHASRMRRRR